MQEADVAGRGPDSNPSPNGHDLAPNGAQSASQGKEEASARETWDQPWKAAPGHLPLVFFHQITPAQVYSDPLVEDFLQLGEISLFFGASTAGKSAFVLDLACHIALGRSYNGKNVTQGLVVVVAAEAGKSWLSRIAAWKKHHGLEEARLPLLIIPLALDLSKRNSPDVRKLIDTIKAAAHGYPIVYVVIDTVINVLAGEDEDKSAAVAEFLLVMRCIGEALGGAHVTGVHHIGKDAARKARGSYVFFTNPDTSVEFTKHDWGTLVTADKQRDDKMGPFCGFKLEPIEIGRNKFGSPIMRVVAELLSEIPIDAAKAGKLAKMTDAEKRAWNLLLGLLGGEGVAQEGRPRKAVKVARWKEWCALNNLSDGKSEDAARKAFDRARTGLQQKEYITEDDGWVWTLRESLADVA